MARPAGEQPAEPERPDQIRSGAPAGEDSLTMGEVYQGGNSENRIKTEKYLFLIFRKEGDRSRTEPEISQQYGNHEIPESGQIAESVYTL